MSRTKTKKNPENTTVDEDVEKDTPQKTLSVTIEEVAARIFEKTYMDSSKTAEHLATKAFEAAETFMSVAQKRLGK